MACRISPAIMTIQTAEANRSPPVMTHPIVTAVPRKNPTPNEMATIQIKHEASRRMNILEG